MSQAEPSRFHFVAFATLEFEQALEMSLRAAAPYCATARGWTRAELVETDFFRAHAAILDEPRGGGYWLWKPYVIRRALDEAPEGDIVFYLDAGAMFVGDPAPLRAMCDRTPAVVFGNPYGRIPGRPDPCSMWTKRDCFVLMGCDEPRFHAAPMLDASIVLVKNGPTGRAFVDEWLRFMSRREIVTDMPNTTGYENLPGFVEHRHDQSVLSLLAAREGLEVFRPPSQHGNHWKDVAWRVPGERRRLPYELNATLSPSPYPTLIEHHRMRVVLWGPNGMPERLGAVVARMRGAPDPLAPEEMARSLTYLEALGFIMDGMGSARLLVTGPPPYDVARIETCVPGATVTIAQAGDGTAFGLPDAMLHTGRIDGGAALEWLRKVIRVGALAERFVVCWSDLTEPRGSRVALRRLADVVEPPAVWYSGTARCPATNEVRTVALICGRRQAPPVEPSEPLMR